MRHSSGFARHWASFRVTLPERPLNLQSMSRAMAVIGPLLRQGMQEMATTAGSAAGQRQRNLASLRAEARSIARAVQAVRAARRRSR